MFCFLSVVYFYSNNSILLAVNLSSNSTQEQDLVKELEKEINRGFKSIWLQRPERWTYDASMFFCCTVFTTVGK